MKTEMRRAWSKARRSGAGPAMAALLWVASAHVGALRADTFVVTTTDDSGPGTLRQAILDANAHPGLDIIQFSLPGDGVQTITPLSALPRITDAVTIDGYSQPGTTENTLSDGSDAVLLVELDGSLAGPVSGLDIAARGCVIRGLIVNAFGQDGIWIHSGNNRIEGNFIGVDPTGLSARGNYYDGVHIGDLTSRVTANLVGGLDPGARNILSGNQNGYGIEVEAQRDTDATGILIQGNFVGTDASGTYPLPNGVGGIRLTGVTHSQVGDTDPGGRNVISGNGVYGVVLSLGSTNTIVGNYIGVDVTGALPLAGSIPVSPDAGITLFASSENTIGGALDGAGNVISGNPGPGVRLSNSARNRIMGNRIGTDATGESALGNAGAGIVIDSTSAVGGMPTNNVIGGNEPGEGNVISGNIADGIRLESGADNTVIQGNLLGTDPSAQIPLPNQTGISADVGSVFQGVLIGGTNSAVTNVIAFNLGDGIRTGPLARAAILGNSIFGNGASGINNGLSNAPVLAPVGVDGDTLEVGGTVSSLAGTTLRLEFFGNAAPDPTGRGEGQTLLGVTNVTTDESGIAGFLFTLPAGDMIGGYLSATATRLSADLSGFLDTSRFSAAAPVTNLFVASASLEALNPQTGLFEQTVVVTNASIFTLPGIRLSVEGLPEGVSLYNATGVTNGTYYVDFAGPTPPDAGVSLLLEFFSATRRTAPYTSLTVEPLEPGETPIPPGIGFAISRVVPLDSGGLLIEFNSTAGRTYLVEYSDDLRTWKAAQPSVVASANRVQWIDDGPPKTDSAPSGSAARYYRVLEVVTSGLAVRRPPSD